MVYNYKKQRTPIVPMYTIRGSTDGVHEKNGGDTRGGKQQIRKIEDTPAPDSYGVPGTIGKQNITMRTAPRFTFGQKNSRHWMEYVGCSPGPAHEAAPNPYSFLWMRGYYFGTPLQHNSMNIPGPGAHSPEHVTINRKSSPMYSFGIRHSLPRAPIIVDKPE